METLETTSSTQIYIALGVLGLVIILLIVFFSNRAKHKARANTLEKVVKLQEKTPRHVEHTKTVVHVEDKKPLEHVEHKKTVIHTEHKKPVEHVEHKETVVHAEHKKPVEHVEHKKTVVHVVEHKKKEDDEDED